MTPRRAAAGFALMAAIFLIAVLAALGLVMATMSKVEHDTGTKSLLSDKVYFGAKAGLEWGIQRAIAPTTPSVAACAASTGPFVLTQGGLNGVSVTVTCSQSLHGAATGVSVFYITSTATIGTLGSINYAERRMEATVSNIL